MKFGFVVSLIAATSVLVSEELDFAKGITTCLLIRDYQTAVSLSKTALSAYPKSDQIRSLMVRALSENGDCLEALTFFQKEFSDKSLKENFSLLETIAWATLNQSEDKKESSRVSALIGASLTGDARTVELICDGLESSNMLIRSFSLRLAPRYNDKAIQKKVLELLKSEKNWYLRLEVLQTVGFMKLQEASSYLRETIASQSVSQEEKISAIHALVNIYDDVQDKDLELLLNHSRSGLRQLGVMIIDHFEKFDKAELLLPLLKDPSPHVRELVLSVLATFDISDRLISKVAVEIEKLEKDVHKECSILASWFRLRYDPEGAADLLMKAVQSDDLAIARYAATLLGAGGDKTKHLLKRALTLASDSFVKANLAVGMIKQKVHVSIAVQTLKEFFMNEDKEIMWQAGIYPMFNRLVPSNYKHVIQIPRYPQVMDHLTRLDLLNILCIAGCNDAKDLVKKFLDKQMWGVVSGASVLLIEEGDNDALNLIRGYLEDENELTKIQAALALAFYGGDPSASKILEEAYKKVDWERKIQILEALGSIGNRDSVPFLLEVMKEPFSLLRTIAASSVIQCLYH
jgi:HEAT repeat protein